MTDKEELKTGLPIDVDGTAPAPNDVDPSFDPVLKNQQEAKAKAEEQARAEMMAEIKAQLIAELQTEQEKKMALAAEERKKAAAERADYVQRMKASKEPWVDVVGMVSDGDGVGIELDWNDAFIDFLRAQGVTGSDDDQVIQKYVTLLLRDMADQIDEESKGDRSEYEG